jgi:hypothetical protein
MRPSELLIQDSTEVDSPFFKRCVPSGLTGTWVEALNDFKTQQVSAKFLDRAFSLPFPYRFESRDTIRSFFIPAGPMGWDVFYATYPKSRGYLQVSAVGFDKAHEHAIVYMAHSCGGLCGQGGYRFLERTAGGWTEARLNVADCGWVS